VTASYDDILEGALAPFRSRTSEPLIVAHRARSGDERENTLEAVEAALERGVEAVEVDARITADGVVVVCHDAEVGDQAVAGSTLADLRAADPTIAALRDVATLTRGRCLLDVDIKESGYEEQVADAVSAWRCPEAGVVFTSFRDVTVGRLKQLCPETPVGLLLGLKRPRRRLATRASELRPLQRLHACGADFAAPHYRLLRLGLARSLQIAGYPVWVWTANTPALLKRLIGDPNIDAVITDDPLRAIGLRDARAAGSA
jgi:glycerophosphoryl diester phosphodiesterase